MVSLNSMRGDFLLLKLTDKDVFLIVDIQKGYCGNFNLDYIEKVYTFLNKYPFQEIRCIVDVFRKEAKGEYIPAFIEEYLTHPVIFKQYSDDFPDYMIREKGQELYKTHIQHKPETSAYFELDGGFLFSLLTDHNHRYFEYLTQEFADVLRGWKEKNKRIHLIGGGYDKCILVTKKILDVLGIENIRYKCFCYEIQPWEDRVESMFECCKKHISKYHPELINRFKKDIRWVFIENKDEKLIKYLKEESS